MSLTFSGGLATPLEQEIFIEEKRYQRSLKADHEFSVLKKIRIKINQLKAELLEQRFLKSRNSGNNIKHYRPECN